MDKFWEHLDKSTDYLNDTYPGTANGDTWSFDWCRFRRHRYCYFAEELNVPVTQAVGYPVWTPYERGQCWRDKWEWQRTCPFAQAGPNSDERGSRSDATIPWEIGGQRDGWYDPTEPIDHAALTTAHPDQVPFLPTGEQQRPYHPSALQPQVGAGHLGDVVDVAALAAGAYAVQRSRKKKQE